MPPQRGKDRLPIYERPLRNTGEFEPRLTHPKFPNMVDNFEATEFENLFARPKYFLPNACVWNAFLNAFKDVYDKKRHPNARKPEMTYEAMFKILFPHQPFPGLHNLPALSLVQFEVLLNKYNLNGKAYDFDGVQIMCRETKDPIYKIKRFLVLYVKDDHAYAIDFWIEKSNSCPVCRAPAYDETIPMLSSQLEQAVRDIEAGATEVLIEVRITPRHTPAQSP